MPAKLSIVATCCCDHTDILVEALLEHFVDFRYAMFAVNFLKEKSNAAS